MILESHRMFITIFLLSFLAGGVVIAQNPEIDLEFLPHPEVDSIVEIRWYPGNVTDISAYRLVCTDTSTGLENVWNLTRMKMLMELELNEEY